MDFDFQSGLCSNIKICSTESLMSIVLASCLKVSERVLHSPIEHSNLYILFAVNALAGTYLCVKSCLGHNSKVIGWVGGKIILGLSYNISIKMFHTSS